MWFFLSFKTITLPRMLTTVKKSETCHFFFLLFFVIALSPLLPETEIDLPPLRREVCLYNKSLHRCNWPQGDIYYKPKMQFKNFYFWNWILWVVVFRLQLFLLVMGVFHKFCWWVVGVKNMHLPTPPHI